MPFNEDALVARVNKRQELEQKFLANVQAGSDPLKTKVELKQLFNYGRLKRILFNHCSTYKQLVDEKDYVTFQKQGKCRDLKELSATLHVPMPRVIIENAIEKIFVFSEFVAIPYLILDSPVMEASHKREVIIVFHDMFDNMYELAPYFVQILKDKTNKRVVLFNFPGQAYTIYQRDVPCTNEYLSSFVDSFFYHLEVKGYADFIGDRIKFTGFGYGGNVLLYYSRPISPSQLAQRGSALHQTPAPGQRLHQRRRLP